MQVLSDGRIRRTAPEWREIIDRFSTSGLGIAAFCEKEEISRSAFASWKKKLSGGRKMGKSSAILAFSCPDGQSLAFFQDFDDLTSRARVTVPGFRTARSVTSRR